MKLSLSTIARRALSPEAAHQRLADQAMAATTSVDKAGLLLGLTALWVGVQVIVWAGRSFW